MDGKILQFDGSWEGLLTAIFEVFEYRIDPKAVIDGRHVQINLFEPRHLVTTVEAKAARVRNGLLEKVGVQGIRELYHVYLSELETAPLLIVKTALYYFAQQHQNGQLNYGHNEVLAVKQIVKSVLRERHRMKAFVRFQLLQDGLYVALIEPDFNVLPLIRKHFKERYADQRWLIYDVKRHYGLYYDLQDATEVTFGEGHDISQHSISIGANQQEDMYSDLWKRYFKSVNIPERKNTKLHLQHVPRRYWRYLNEKEGF